MDIKEQSFKIVIPDIPVEYIQVLKDIVAQNSKIVDLLTVNLVYIQDLRKETK